MTIRELLAAHQAAIHQTLNLVASENLMSPDATAAAASDLASRYCIPPADERPAAIWDYPNQRAPRGVDRIACQYARELFGAAYADCRPLSGNNAACILLKALVRKGGLVLNVPADCGGHFATEAICRDIGCDLMPLVYDREQGVIDVQASKRAAANRKVDLIFLDASAILFPHPVRDLRAAFGPDVVIAYDASHVMGLIAGGQFQHPLEEGADLLQGSTHKSLFGPQKGLFACRENGYVARRIADGVVPLFVSNVHVHHTAALAIALEEMQKYGAAYAEAVVANASGLASVLAAGGCVPAFESRGFTRSHQVILPIGTREQAVTAFLRLEAAGIHTNCVGVPFADGFGLRLGVAELTRRGFLASDMQSVGQAIADVITDRRSLEDVAITVKELSSGRRTLKFWLGADAEAPEVARRATFEAG